MRRGERGDRWWEDESERRRRSEGRHAWGVGTLDGPTCRAGRLASSLLDRCPFEQNPGHFLVLLRALRTKDRAEGDLFGGVRALPEDAVHLVARFLGSSTHSDAGRRRDVDEPRPVCVPTGPEQSDQFNHWLSRYDLHTWNDRDRDHLCGIWLREYDRGGPSAELTYEGWGIDEWQKWAIKRHVAQWDLWVRSSDDGMDACTVASSTDSLDDDGFPCGATYRGCTGADAIQHYLIGHRRAASPRLDLIWRWAVRFRRWCCHPSRRASVRRASLRLLKLITALASLGILGLCAYASPSNAVVILLLWFAALCAGASCAE